VVTTASNKSNQCLGTNWEYQSWERKFQGTKVLRNDVPGNQGS